MFVGHRFPRMLSVSGLLAVLAVCCAENHALAIPAKFNYWIEQSAPNGPHDIQVSDQGVFIAAPKAGFSLQYNRADKSVTMWSPQKHVYYVIPYAKWITSYRNLYAAVGWYSELTKPVKSTVSQKDNVTQRTYNYVLDAASPSYWRSDIGQAYDKQQFRNVDLTTIELPVFSEAGAIVERVYGLPHLSGIPYKLRRRGESNFSVRTTKMVAASPKPFPVFKPDGFKKVAFSNQLFAPTLDENMTNMMLPY